MLKPDAPTDAVLLAWQLEKKLANKRLALSDFLQQQGLGHRLSEFTDFDEENTTFGAYAIHQKVGSGGYGSVYLAYSPDGNRIAVKILDDELETKRFQDEVRTLQSLNHSNLPEFLGSGTDTKYGKPFLAMEFISATQDSLDQAAPDLSSFLAAQSLDLAQTIQLFLQLLDGLSYCHNRDITHRDIKPRNILVSVTESGPCVKLVDFGISLNESRGKSLTATQTRLGTNSYMSPEQLRAEKLTNKSDIFSVGILLYESITGVHPFDPLGQCLPADTNGRILYADPPRPLMELASNGTLTGISTVELERDRLNQLDAILRSTLQLNQDKRPSADGLRQQLQTFLEGGLVSPNVESFPDALKRLYAKHKWPVRVVAALLVGLTAGLIGVIYGLVITIQKNDEIRSMAKFADCRAEIATNKFLEFADSTTPASRLGANSEEYRQKLVQIAREGFAELSTPMEQGKAYQNIEAEIRFAKTEGEFFSRMGNAEEALAAFQRVVTKYASLEESGNAAARDCLVSRVRLADQCLGFLRYHDLHPALSIPDLAQGGIQGPAIIVDFQLVKGCYTLFDEQELLAAKSQLQSALPIAEKLANDGQNELAYSDLGFVHAKLSELGYHLADQALFEEHDGLAREACQRAIDIASDSYYARVVLARQLALAALVEGDLFRKPAEALKLLEKGKTLLAEARKVRESQLRDSESLDLLTAKMQNTKGAELMNLSAQAYKMKHSLGLQWEEDHPDYFLDVPTYWSTGFESLMVEMAEQIQSRQSNGGVDSEPTKFVSPSVTFRSKMQELKGKPWKSKAGLSQITMGTPKAKVIEILGKPSQENPIINGSEFLYYDPIDSARIAFDATELVSYIEPPFKSY